MAKPVLPTLVLHWLAHDGRRWTATPPLRLAVQPDGAGFMVADPTLGLVARARTIDHLDEALGLALARDWDGLMIEHWEIHDDASLARMMALLGRFTVRGKALRTSDWWPSPCREGCLGGNGIGCFHGRSR